MPRPTLRGSRRAEVFVQNRVWGIGTGTRKLLGRQAGLVDGVLDGVGIGVADQVRHLTPEAWALLQELSNLTPLGTQGLTPTRTAQRWLRLPFQQMEHDHAQAAFELSAIAPAHGCDLLRQILPVERIEMPGAQQCRLLLRPSVQVLIVARAPGCGDACLGHGFPRTSRRRLLSRLASSRAIKSPGRRRGRDRVGRGTAGRRQAEMSVDEPGSMSMPRGWSIALASACVMGVRSHGRVATRAAPALAPLHAEHERCERADRSRRSPRRSGPRISASVAASGAWRRGHLVRHVEVEAGVGGDLFDRVAGMHACQAKAAALRHRSGTRSARSPGRTGRPDDRRSRGWCRAR